MFCIVCPAQVIKPTQMKAMSTFHPKELVSVYEQMGNKIKEAQLADLQQADLPTVGNNGTGLNPFVSFRDGASDGEDTQSSSSEQEPYIFPVSTLKLGSSSYHMDRNFEGVLVSVALADQVFGSLAKVVPWPT